jgi:succinyl-CoA synthetase beta subunit
MASDGPGDGKALDLGDLPDGPVAEHRAKPLLARVGVPVPEGELAQDLAGAEEIAARIGFPVALKAQAAALAHKSDAGGVILDVHTRRELESAIRRVLAAGRGHDPVGVLIQPMAAPGVELIVGGRRDPQFGPLVLVGIGGVLAEVFDDVAVRLAPISAGDAREMLAELRGARLLEGVRGRRAVSHQAIAELIARLGDVLEAHPAWREVDLNPVFAGRDAIAVDALIITDVRDPDWDFEDPGGAADA